MKNQVKIYNNFEKLTDHVITNANCEKCKSWPVFNPHIKWMCVCVCVCVCVWVGVCVCSFQLFLLIHLIIQICCSQWLFNVNICIIKEICVEWFSGCCLFRPANRCCALLCWLKYIISCIFPLFWPFWFNVMSKR